VIWINEHSHISTSRNTGLRRHETRRLHVRGGGAGFGQSRSEERAPSVNRGSIPVFYFTRGEIGHRHYHSLVDLRLILGYESH
jgi:hypothetical protein